MPQLDLVSYFSQIFWFLLLFLTFYFLLYNKVIFYLGSCIKIRNKKLIKASSNSDQFSNEIINFSNNYNKLFKNSIQTSTFSFTQSFIVLNANLKETETTSLNTTGTLRNIRFFTIFGSFIAIKDLIIKYY